jgi:iron complex outermembrane recepter protein
MRSRITLKLGRLGSTAVLAAITAWAAPAQAQTKATSKDTSNELEEVLVTGQKRAESVQKVPISITAISAESLEKSFRNDILALTEMAPGVSLGQMAGFKAIAGGIRGTGQNSILVTQDASVAILVDEFGLNHVQSQFVENFDVDRIEIYRGPQGTLFGKNATGGAISIFTRRPVMNQYSTDVVLQSGKFTNNDAAIAKGQVAINLPLVQDKLALRLTGIYDYDGGYYTNDKAANNFPNVQPIWAALGFPPLPAGLDTTHRGAGERLGGTNVFAGRVKALWTPTENYEAYFFAEYLRDTSPSTPAVNETPALGQVDPTGGPQFQLVPLLGFDGIRPTNTSPYSTGIDRSCWSVRAFCVAGHQTIDVDGYHLHQKLELDKISLQLLMGYRREKEILPNDYTGEAFMSLYDAARNLKRKSTQFELRGATKFDGPFNFTAGATYQTDNVDWIAYQTVGLLSLVSFLPSQDPGNTNPLIAGGTLNTAGALNLDLDYINDPQMQAAKQDRKTFAVYWDGSYKLTDKWTLTAGVRYTKDKKDFIRRMNPGGPCTALTPAKDQVIVAGNCLDKRSNAVSRTGVPLNQIDPFVLPGTDANFGLILPKNDSWQKVTWRAVASYQFNPDVMSYFSVATGFISGGFTEQCSQVITCIPFAPETNTNIELGLKSRWLDGRLQLNGSIYGTRYKNLVRSQVVPFVDIFGNPGQETVNVNAGQSQVYGLELEGSWLPMLGLRIDGNFSYMHHTYKEFILNGQDLSNLNVPFSPKTKAGLAVSKTWNVGSGSIDFTPSVNYQSEAEMSVFNSLYSQMTARTLIDANITWRPADSKYRLTLWGKNLSDKEYRIASNPVAGLWNMTNYGRPRSYGIEVGVHFQ